MAGKLHTLPGDLLTRRCVCCGYDGALLRGGHALRCARCGCDLHERPARSYAEMEGFIGQRQVIARPSRRVGGDSSMLQRWLFFLFVVLLGMAAVAALARELAIGAG